MICCSNTNANITVVMVRPVLEAGLGPVILLPTVKPTRGPATAALGNGKRIKPQLGVNLVAALQTEGREDRKVVARLARGGLGLWDSVTKPRLKALRGAGTSRLRGGDAVLQR